MHTYLNWYFMKFITLRKTRIFCEINFKFANFTGSQSDDSKSHWIRRASLVDSRTSVTDVKFGPRHLGLLLATCSADGVVRIYEAADVMNLGQWSLQHEIQCKLSCSCISWNTSLSKLQPPMIAVGSDDSSTTSGAKVITHMHSVEIWELSGHSNFAWNQFEL